MIDGTSVNNNKKALKSGVWYTASNFLIKSIGFITTPIFTRLLTKTEFGLYNNYTSWLSIVMIFVTLNLESTLISARFDFKEKFDEYILSMLSLSSISALVWVLVANLWSSKIETLLGLPKVYINAMLIYLLALPAINFFQARERYYYEYKKTVITSMFLSVGTALLSVVLVVFLPDKLSGRIIGAVLPTIIMGIAFYGFFVKKGKRIKIHYWKYALPICIPYIPHLLSMTLLNAMDRIMIDRWCGSEQTALYSLAYNCGAIVTLLLNSINSAFSPWLGEKLSENKCDEVRAFSKVYISGFIVFSFGIMLIAPEVLLLLGGKNYYEAIYVMTPVSMGCICQFLYTLFVNVEQFKTKTIGMAIASVIAAIINLLLNWALIPKIGYLAAAYTTLVGYLCLLVMHMYLVYRMRLHKIYSYKFILTAVIVSLIVMVLVTFLYSNAYLRYVICTIYCVTIFAVCYKFRKKIFHVIKKKK